MRFSAVGILQGWREDRGSVLETTTRLVMSLPGTESIAFNIQQESNKVALNNSFPQTGDISRLRSHKDV